MKIAYTFWYLVPLPQTNLAKTETSTVQPISDADHDAARLSQVLGLKPAFSWSHETCDLNEAKPCFIPVAVDVVVVFILDWRPSFHFGFRGFLAIQDFRCNNIPTHARGSGMRCICLLGNGSQVHSSYRLLTPDSDLSVKRVSIHTFCNNL